MRAHRFHWLLLLSSVLACRLNLEGEKQKDDPADDTAANGGATSPAREPEQTDTRPDSVATSGSRRAPRGIDCTRPETLAGGQDFPAAEGGTLHLSGLIRVTGSPNFSGNIVIDPGTTFVMPADSSFHIARWSERTTLTAKGTVADPIRFCAERAGAGYWDALYISDALTSDSLLENVVVYGAGSNGAAVYNDSPLKITNLGIYGAKYDGLEASVFGANSTGLLVDGAGRDAVVLTALTGVDSLPTGSTFTKNTNNLIRIKGYRIDSAVTFRNPGIPYVAASGLRVDTAGVIFEAGVDVGFAPDQGMEVGWNGGKASIRVAGTQAAPVTFHALETGTFGGVTIQSSTSADSTLQHVRIANGPLAVRASITLSDVSVEDSAKPSELSVPLNSTSSGLIITGAKTQPLNATFPALVGLPPGSAFTGNADDRIWVSGGSSIATGTIAAAGVPFLITGDIGLKEPSDLILGPGVELAFQSGYKYGMDFGMFGGKVKLVMAGSAERPVIFRGEKNDPGSWSGLVLEGGVSTDSSIDHIQVSGAGLSVSTPIPITNSSFSGSSGYGIDKSSSNTTDYRASNSFAGNTSGDVSP